MPEESFSYKSLDTPVEGVIHKDRKSKFIGYAYPISSEADFKHILNTLKGKYADANHICYAWQLGQKDMNYRVQDDGEPRNSAGKPIHGQINSFGITNIAVLVVRYFGGVKLGVGGLISAYKTTARETLLLGNIKKFELSLTYQLSFSYSQMSAVMRNLEIIQAKIIHRELGEGAVLRVAVPKKRAIRLVEAMKQLQEVMVEEVSE